MTTPRWIVDTVVRSACGRNVERLVPVTGGGMNETYRAELPDGVAVVARVAHQPEPWFVDEARLMARARDLGVPTPDVLGVEHLEHNGELLSFSIQQYLPGRPLDQLVGELPPSDLKRLVVDGGELLARIHSAVADRGVRHRLRLPEDAAVARVARIVDQALGPQAATLVERGAEFLRKEVSTRRSPNLSLAHGDFLPKNLLVDDSAIVGVIDWEFAGPAPAAFDLARWQVSAGTHWRGRWDGPASPRLARVTDPETAAAGLVPAFAVDWALEKLGWKNPASPAQFQRCVDVIAHYASP